MMFHWGMHSRRTLLLSLFILLAAQGLLVALRLTPLLEGELVDSDGYMRLLRAELWLSGQAGWFDQGIPGSNWPYGETLHWTRPLDVILALGALPLSLFMPLRDALWVAGVAVSPLLKAASLLAFSWGTRAYLSERGFLLLAALFCLAMPGAELVYIAGRPDHHALEAFLLVLMLCAFLKGRPALAGFGAAMALWGGGEGLPILLAGLAGLGLSWLDVRQETRAAARRTALFTAALAGWTALFLVLDRPPALWLEVEYDRLSIVHLTLTGLLAAAGAGLLLEPRRERRWLRGLIALLAVLGAMAALFPGFFAGPAVDIDPALRPIWLDSLSEAQPVNPLDPKARSALLLHLWPVLMGAVYLIGQLRSAKPDLPPAACWHFLAALLTLGGLALVYVRMAGFAQAAAVLPWALLLAALMRSPRRVWRVPLVLAALLGHVPLAALAAPPAAQNALPRPSVAGCSWRALASYLNLQEDKAAVLSTIYAGPEILWRTGRGVVATPYHRNAAGILDMYRVLSAEEDATPRAILARRGIGLVALCRWNGQARPGTLEARLLAGDPPSWLLRLGPKGAKLEEFLLYKIVQPPE
jgi:hypothetical protein